MDKNVFREKSFQFAVRNVTKILITNNLTLKKHD